MNHGHNTDFSKLVNLCPVKKFSLILTPDCYNDVMMNYSCLTLKPPNNLSHSFNKLNTFSSDISKTDFDIIAISESRSIKCKLPTYVCLTNYNHEFCPTEADAGDNLTCIKI